MHVLGHRKGSGQGLSSGDCPTAFSWGFYLRPASHLGVAAFLGKHSPPTQRTGL